jgi:hypothetical protein
MGKDWKGRGGGGEGHKWGRMGKEEGEGRDMERGGGKDFFQLNRKQSLKSHGTGCILSFKTSTISLFRSIKSYKN